MYVVMSLVSILSAVGLWLGSTVPFLRKNSFDPDPHYATWGIDIFRDFKIAIYLALFTRKGKAPIGVYLHGVMLVSTIVFWILAYRSGEFG